MAKYAEVVLPLPLPGTYTYTLPESLQNSVRVGCRLIVPFGVKKMYSSLVVSLSDEPPSCDVSLKEAMELLDEQPVVLPRQLSLWRWIADYYLCTLGEVYKAALPGGMKLESETLVVINPDFEDHASLSPSEKHALDILEGKKEQKVRDLQTECGVKNVLPVVKSLLEKGAVVVKEEMKRSYRPKTINCVTLSNECFSEEKLREVLASLQRSRRQYELLCRYLEMSQAKVALRLQNKDLLEEVTKADLMEGFGPAVFRELKDKGILEVYAKAVGRLGVQSLPDKVVLLPLSPAQQQAKDAIQQQLRQHEACLLHGVTGSGKTEVYVHLIQEVLQGGGQVLYLLPEIVLTAQLVDRLKRVFGDRLGVYHSKYSDAERVEVWQKQLSDTPYDIIVGVRSSVFLPFQNLKLVIVDEEHESSFKQQDPAPRYHARNVALVLARMFGARSLLGTATPSLESYYNAQQGKFGLVSLTERYGQVSLPEIQCVDVKELRRKKLMKGFFSPPLLSAMRQALEHKEQIILFQNRRGYSPQIECHECGWTPRCKHCDVSLTYHKGMQRMTCHYCGATYPIPPKCPCCESTKLSHMGYGTERIEDEIQSLFPSARIARMDLDTTRSQQGYERIIYDFQHGKTDILVGTQMVTKGLDFDRVRLVGILNADTMLNAPDFRSYERSFQMMTQVAGRAGRRQLRGQVFLQTKAPDLDVVSRILHNDYTGLYEHEIEEREAFRYPPFCHLIYVYLKHRDEREIQRLAQDMASLMQRVFGSRVLGPDTPPVGRVQNYYIRKLVLKIENGASMADARSRLRRIQSYLLSQPGYKVAQVYYDVDPY